MSLNARCEGFEKIFVSTSEIGLGSSFPYMIVESKRIIHVVQTNDTCGLFSPDGVQITHFNNPYLPQGMGPFSNCSIDRCEVFLQRPQKARKARRTGNYRKRFSFSVYPFRNYFNSQEKYQSLSATFFCLLLVHL